MYVDVDLAQHFKQLAPLSRNLALNSFELNDLFTAIVSVSQKDPGSMMSMTMILSFYSCAVVPVNNHPISSLCYQLHIFL